MKRHAPIKGEYADIYIRIGKSRINLRHQLKRTTSAVYGCDEYVWRGRIANGRIIRFSHGDERIIPDANCYNQISGPGVTFSGAECCADLHFERAITCPVEGQDLIYNFVDGDSMMTYVGKPEIHTIFIRVYDNNSGIHNDRWVVVAME